MFKSGETYALETAGEQRSPLPLQEKPEQLLGHASSHRKDGREGEGNMDREERYVGVSTCPRGQLDVAVLPGREQWSIANTSRGVDDLAAALGPMRVVLAVVEATGGLKRAVNPRQVRDFAKASGRLAKTDRLDAEVLAHFEMAMRPRPSRLSDAATQAFEAQLERRRLCPI